jgi:hypothetical protein
MDDEMSDTFATIDLSSSGYKLDGIDQNNNSEYAGQDTASQRNAKSSAAATVDQTYTSFGSEAYSDNGQNSNMNGGFKKQLNYINGDKQNGSYKPLSSSNSLSTGFGSQSQANGAGGTSGVNLTSILDGNLSTQSVISSASEASVKLASKTASTIESLRLWGKSAYKCTRQLVSERLGKTSRTVDPEIEAEIEVIMIFLLP